MAATSQLLGDLARWLGSKGWEVVAIAGRASYANGGNVNGSGTERVWDGVVIRRVWCTNFGRGNLLGRMCDYTTFLVSAGGGGAFCFCSGVAGFFLSPAFFGAV